MDMLETKNAGKNNALSAASSKGHTMSKVDEEKIKLAKKYGLKFVSSCFVSTFFCVSFRSRNPTTHTIYLLSL